MLLIFVHEYSLFVIENYFLLFRNKMRMNNWKLIGNIWFMYWKIFFFGRNICICEINIWILGLQLQLEALTSQKTWNFKIRKLFVCSFVIQKQFPFFIWKQKKSKQTCIDLIFLCIFNFVLEVQLEDLMAITCWMICYWMKIKLNSLMEQTDLELLMLLDGLME